MNEKLEKKFKNRLKKETTEITTLKEETWNKINHELFPKHIKKVGWIRGITATLGTVAVAAILFFVLLSGNFIDQTKEDPDNNHSTQGANDSGELGDPDQNNENDPENDPENNQENEPDNDPNNTETEIPLEDQFEHEKEVEIELEGMTETVQVQLATNDTWGYIIYFDKEMYEFTHGEEVDKISSVHNIEGYPEIGMEIRKVTGLSREEVIEDVKKTLASEGMYLKREESITTPIESLMILAEGNEDGAVQSDTPIHRYYITEEKNGNIFVFKQKFFVEAWDGSPRLDMLLESFEIVD